MATLTPLTSPVFAPQPAVGNIRYGLFAAANGPFPMPQHGEVGGVQYLEEHCGSAHLIAGASCSNPTVTLSPFDGCDGVAVGLPFQVGATLKAGTWPYTADEVERRLRVRLNDNAQFVNEQAFWGGNADVQSSLQRTDLNSAGILDVTPTPGTPTTIEYGVGLLEDALAQYSYQGVLHARPYFAPYLAERRMAVGAPKALKYTPLDNVWSFGRGYSGNKPNNEAAPAAGTGYIVATGQVTIWRDDTVYVTPPEREFDRSGNNWQASAQQAYAITIDCVAFYVLVELDAITRGTGAVVAGTLY